MGIVVKRGNTLDGVADTLTATEADLARPLVALSTVEEPPAPVHRVGAGVLGGPDSPRARAAP